MNFSMAELVYIYSLTIHEKNISPNKIPGVGLEVGATIEGEITFATTRYNLFVDGKEICLIDKLAGICRINGKDYAGEIGSML